MISKTIEYVDYNGESRKEKFYFNMSKAELLKENFRFEGGMENYLKKLVNPIKKAVEETAMPEGQEGVDIMSVAPSDKVYSLFEWIEWLIDASYGVKTPDGRFVKSPEELEKFKSSEAYSELLTCLVLNPEYANEFTNGIFSTINESTSNFVKVK